MLQSQEYMRFTFSEKTKLNIPFFLRECEVSFSENIQNNCLCKFIVVQTHNRVLCPVFYTKKYIEIMTVEN